MAMGQYQKILQVVGYQNSGKTTLMEQFIREATATGLRVATIKHHGHGGIPDVESSKDSMRHERAGAAVAAVEGGGVLRLSAKRDHWNLEEILALYQHFPIDLILIEGYKHASYPKIVILQMEEDYELLTELHEIMCVLYWPTYTGELPTNYPTFSIDAKEDYLAFLCKEKRFEHAGE